MDTYPSGRPPEDYHRFITTISCAGSQPFYGLLLLRLITGW